MCYVIESWYEYSRKQNNPLPHLSFMLATGHNRAIAILVTNCTDFQKVSLSSEHLLPLTPVSVQFSPSVRSDSLRPHEPQHARPPCLSPAPGAYPNPCPLSRWCHPTISSLSSPSPPALNLSQHQDLFKWVSSSHQVAKVLKFQLQHQSLQWTPRAHLP